MRNRPAIVLILLAIIVVVALQFVVTARGNSTPPAAVAQTDMPTAPRTAAAATPTPEQTADYGGLTPEEFYARQDAEETAAELAVRESNQGERPPAEFDGLEGVSPWGVYDELDPPAEDEPVPTAAPAEMAEPTHEEVELTEDERAAQEAVEEILNRE